jgi:hypothetical protein
MATFGCSQDIGVACGFVARPFITDYKKTSYIEKVVVGSLINHIRFRPASPRHLAIIPLIAMPLQA